MKLNLYDYHNKPDTLDGFDEHMTMMDDGIEKQLLNGELHSFNDLPAVTYPDGDKFWFSHGKRHRDNDLPAIEYPNGEKRWYHNGEFVK